MNHSFLKCLALDAPTLIAFTGGGGKTSLMWRLARELKEQGEMVAVATTTRIWVPAPWEADAVIIRKEAVELREEAERALKKGKVITVAPGVGINGKLLPAEEAILLQLLNHGAYVLVEADGAAGLPFKAPAEHEPVVPPFTGLQVLVFGLDALGQPLSADFCHRPERIAAISGKKLGDFITPELAADVLTSPMGGLKGRAPHSELVVCLNKADNRERLDLAAKMAPLLLRRGIKKVLVTTAQNEPLVRQMWEDKK